MTNSGPGNRRRKTRRERTPRERHAHPDHRLLSRWFRKLQPESGAKDRPLPPPPAGRHGDPIEEFYTAKHHDLVISAVEKMVRRGRPETPRHAWLYARSCLEIGQPERVLRTAERFADRTWRHHRFRAQVFQALLCLDRVDKAKALVEESLLLGAFDMESLLRFVGEYRRIGDGDLIRVLIDLLCRHWAGRLNVPTSCFLQNVLLNTGSPLDAFRYAKPAGGDRFHADRYLLLANAALRSGDHAGALNQFNRVLRGFGLSPAILRERGQPFAAWNLAGAGGLPARDGPLVSIAMSTFNASTTVVPALMSLSAQTYRNIEILVVDDCSLDNTADLVQRYAFETDARVRFSRMNENGGAYQARNRALGEARGKYFTCNDADDWSHPEKIALLVEALDKGTAAAVQSALIRLSPETGIKPKRLGYIHDDMSSTLFRREMVLDRIGYYEPVRFGADSEYVQRILRAFGPAAIDKITKPLLVAHWADNTLSAGPGTGISDSGIFYPQRAAYRNAYRMRHARGEGLKRGSNGELVASVDAIRKDVNLSEPLSVDR